VRDADKAIMQAKKHEYSPHLKMYEGWGCLIIGCDYFALKKDSVDNHRQDTHKGAHSKAEPNST
jgi:hypothetical protein